MVRLNFGVYNLHINLFTDSRSNDQKITTNINPNQEDKTSFDWISSVELDDNENWIVYIYIINIKYRL